MKLLLTGASGQLGTELLATTPTGYAMLTPDEQALDLSQPEKVAGQVRDMAPDIIINAAAYTAVDKAESEAELAQRINADAAGALATAAAACNAYFVQISTDFVFDGTSSKPYLPDSPTTPLGAYGRSKRDGELMVLNALGESALILRTAWLYSAQGNNFVTTMLRLMAERDELGIVQDQIGSPTWAAGLAQAVWRACELRLTGVHHWTDAGVASWYDFALAIRELGLQLQLLDKAAAIRPIRSMDYPTPARRPACSVLDKTATWAALQLPVLHWREALASTLSQLAAGME